MRQTLINRAAHRQPMLLALVMIVIGGGSAVSGQATQAVQQLRIQWTAPTSGVSAALGQPRADSFKVLERRLIAGARPRQRNPQLSADQLVVQAFDARGALVDSQIIPDPRILRAESAGPTGELAGQVVLRPDPDFLITLPDSTAIVELRLLQPRWTGNGFVLDPIGSISLR
jgi:hypothetical protein